MTSVGSITTTPATGDISSIEGTLRPEPGAPAKVHINHRGEVETNFGKPFGELKNSSQEIMNQVVKGLATTYESLSEQLAEAEAKGMTGTADAIKKQMGKIENMLDTIKETVERYPKDATKWTMGSHNDAFGHNKMAVHFSKLSNELIQDVGKSNFSERIGMTPSTDAPDAVGGKGAVSDMEGSKGGSGIKGADGQELSAEHANLVQMDPATLHNTFASDPEGTWKSIASLPPQDRNMVMQALQMAIQQDNQLQSMLSNFMKSMHDTAKATISNLRV